MRKILFNWLKPLFYKAFMLSLYDRVLVICKEFYMKVKGLLFDLDGTLIDTTDLIIKSFQHSFTQCLNQSITATQIIESFGLPLRVAMSKYAPETEVDNLCESFRRFHLNNHDQLIKSFEQVAETLKKLKMQNYKIAVVTSKRCPMASKGLRFLDLDSYIDIIIGSDSCINHKPHPEPMQKAALALGLSPNECLCIGDSPFDLQSGNNADCYGTIAVKYTYYNWEEMLLHGKPNYTINKISDLLNIISSINNKN